MQSAPAVYDAWYQSDRGSWVGQQEFSTLLKLFTPNEGQTLLIENILPNTMSYGGFLAVGIKR